MRTSFQFILTTAGAALLLGSLAGPARAAATILHNFGGGASDGAQPLGSLSLSGSKLYGMTMFGGSSIYGGTIFSMNPDGTGFGLLHSFTGGASDGRAPYGSLTISGSKLYGMTRNGGVSDAGTIFSMNNDGSGFGLLHTFTSGVTDGGYPVGSLTLSSSTLYGMTTNGGSGNVGTIFRMNIDGTGFALLRSFTGTLSDIAYPYGSLTISGSKLYGMTQYDGATDRGMVFSMNTDGTGFSVLHSFTGNASDGAHPSGSLTLSGSGLYGMTTNGGSSDGGTVFSMHTDGTGFGLLHSFAGGVSDGRRPFGSLTLSDSTLYGMTGYSGGSDKGTLFSIGTDGTAFGLLESFGGAPADGGVPNGDLTISGDGLTLYGMTSAGGSANQGVVFSRAIPEPGAIVLLGIGAPALLGFRRRTVRY